MPIGVLCFMILFSVSFTACCIFFFKQKTAYELRISDWSSDVCSSDLEQIVEDAEHRLLHLAGILRAADQDQLLGEVDRDHRFAALAILRRVGAEARQVVAPIFGRAACQLPHGRPAPTMADSLPFPGRFGADLTRDALLGLQTHK